MSPYKNNARAPREFQRGTATCTPARRLRGNVQRVVGRVGRIADTRVPTPHDSGIPAVWSQAVAVFRLTQSRRRRRFRHALRSLMQNAHASGLRLNDAAQPQ